LPPSRTHFATTNFAARKLDKGERSIMKLSVSALALVVATTLALALSSTTLALSTTARGLSTDTTNTQAQSETLIVPFTRADGAITQHTYYGSVQITVSGTGQSLATAFNDAFYVFTDESGNFIAPIHYRDYYQLAWGSSTLLPYTPSNDIYFDIPGGVPAYQPSHVYTFTLNTKLTTPAHLHFGVEDGDYADNSGAYLIKITQIGAASGSGGAGASGGVAIPIPR